MLASNAWIHVQIAYFLRTAQKLRLKMQYSICTTFAPHYQQTLMQISDHFLHSLEMQKPVGSTVRWFYPTRSMLPSERPPAVAAGLLRRWREEMLPSKPISIFIAQVYCLITYCRYVYLTPLWPTRKLRSRRLPVLSRFKSSLISGLEWLASGNHQPRCMLRLSLLP